MRSQPSVQHIVSRLIAIIIGSLACTILASLWLQQLAYPNGTLTPTTILLSIFLCASVVFCGLYPVHIRHNTKIILTTIPLFASALLLPPAFAAISAGIGICLIDLLSRSRTGNTISDIITASGRWVLIIYTSTAIAPIDAMIAAFSRM